MPPSATRLPGPARSSWPGTTCRAGSDAADDSTLTVAALARWLAGFAVKGDVFALSGDLGAGKTTLARAFLRAATQDPELEAPSPTFTLIQTYDAPRFTVVHADFYRLRGPAELLQLGWDETVDEAVTLVEWPERAGKAAWSDALALTLAGEGEGRALTAQVPPGWRQRWPT